MRMSRCWDGYSPTKGNKRGWLKSRRACAWTRMSGIPFYSWGICIITLLCTLITMPNLYKCVNISLVLAQLYTPEEFDYPGRASIAITSSAAPRVERSWQQARVYPGQRRATAGHMQQNTK